jgi:hypothetical protein
LNGLPNQLRGKVLKLAHDEETIDYLVIKPNFLI